MSPLTTRPPLAASPRTREIAFAALIFTAITVVAFFPLVHRLETSVLSEPGDASSTARDYWAASAQGRTPFTLDLDRFLYAPGGQPRSTAVQIANAAQPGFVMVARHWFGFLGGLNLYMLIGFPLTAIVMYALLRRLGLHVVASGFGALAFAFSWWQQEQVTYGHTAFTQLWIFPLLTLSLLWLFASPRVVRGLAVGVALAASFYLSSYLGLIAAALTAVFVLVEAAYTPALRSRRALGVLLTPWIAAVALLAPALFASRFQPSDTLGLPQLAVSALVGSNLLDFVVPSAHHPFFGSLVRAWRPDHVGERVLFFGFTTVALALDAIAVRKRILSRTRDRIERASVFRLAVVLVPAGILLSLPAYATVFGVHVPVPNAAFVIGHQVSWWRIYSRLGVLTGFGLAVLAAFALDAILRSRMRWRLGFATACLALLVIELVPGLPVKTYAVAEESATTRWLQRHPGGIVALYPMQQIGSVQSDAVREWDRYTWGSLYAQTQHGHPLFALPSLPVSGGRKEATRVASFNLNRPLTAEILRGEGVRFVVANFDIYRALGLPDPRPASQLRPVARLGRTHIYAVRGPGITGEDLFRPLLSPVVTLVRGFKADEIYAGEAARWMRQDAIIQVDNGNVKRAATLRYRFTIRGFSNAIPRRISLIDESGRVLGETIVDTPDQDYTIRGVRLPPGSSRLMLRASPGPQRLGTGDPRRTSIFVRHIAVNPTAGSLAQMLAPAGIAAYETG